MKNIFTFLLLLFAMPAFAQLPANPWATNNIPTQTNSQNNQATNAAPQPSTIHNNTPVYAVDPWALSRDTSGKKTWRGSARHGRLNYTGEATTYNTAMGQEMIAPEVNRGNMTIMLDHFRSLGYKIPQSYNDGVMDAPARYGAQLQKKYDSIMNANIQSNPVEGMSKEFIEMFNNYTGLDTENLLMNSIKLLGTD